jgi:Holliday junction resolvase
MREKAVEDKIKHTLSLLGKNVWFFKHAASASMKKGIPDIIACINGKFVGIEVKQANGHQSDEQKVCEQNILDAGGEYWLVFSYEQFMRKLTAFIKGE